LGLQKDRQGKTIQIVRVDCTHVPSVLYIIYTVHKCHQSCAFFYTVHTYHHSCTFFILNTRAIIPVHFLYCTECHQSCTLFIPYTGTISPVHYLYCTHIPSVLYTLYTVMYTRTISLVQYKYFTAHTYYQFLH